MSNYVTIHEEYLHKFFQLPKVFFTNERYMNMSNNAKVAWAILRDRSSLSRKNKWYDQDTGRVYFIFTNEDLMALLNIGSKTTIANIKKELEKANLIESKRIGLNRPNKMYLLYPEVDDEDISKIDEFEGYDYEEPEKNSQTLDTQGSTETGRPESVRQEVQNVYPINTEFSNTKLKELDTLDTRDTKKSVSNQKVVDNVNKSFSEEERLRLKEEYMERAFYENEDRVPEIIARTLKVFSASPEEAKSFYKIILTAKRAAETDVGMIIWLENHVEIQHKITNAFSRAIRKIEREQTVNNPKGYIYKSIYDLLIEEFKTSYSSNANHPFFYDWISERE